MKPVETPQAPEQVTNPRTAKEAYQKMLRLDNFPKSPEELPQSVFIPKEALGNLEESITETNYDGIGARERSQLIGFDDKLGFTPGKVFIGNQSDIGIQSRLYITARSFFGKKGFLTYHTHPGDIVGYSPADTGTLRMTPRNVFLDLVGSDRGILALLQTAKTARMPVYATLEGGIFRYKHNNLIKKLKESFRFGAYKHDEIYGVKALLNFIRETAQLMENEGYGYYAWVSPSGRLERGDLEKGLKLERVLGNEKLILQLASLTLPKNN